MSTIGCRGWGVGCSREKPNRRRMGWAQWCPARFASGVLFVVRGVSQKLATRVSPCRFCPTSLQLSRLRSDASARESTATLHQHPNSTRGSTNAVHGGMGYMRDQYQYRVSSDNRVLKSRRIRIRNFNSNLSSTIAILRAQPVKAPHYQNTLRMGSQNWFCVCLGHVSNITEYRSPPRPKILKSSSGACSCDSVRYNRHISEYPRVGVDP